MAFPKVQHSTSAIDVSVHTSGLQFDLWANQFVSKSVANWTTTDIQTVYNIYFLLLNNHDGNNDSAASCSYSLPPRWEIIAFAWLITFHYMSIEPPALQLSVLNRQIILCWSELKLIGISGRLTGQHHASAEVKRDVKFSISLPDMLWVNCGH